MRSIEYRRWAPLASRLSVEFPSELLMELGWADSSGILYGSGRGREVRVSALNVRQDEEQEKVGVFASRIRGEVFLTEIDLNFMNQQRVDLALVVAGQRAGFFVREANGSIQTVRSHEEFSVSEEMPAEPAAMAPAKRKWVPAGAVALAGLPLVALAMFPQHSRLAQGSIEVREAAPHQLHITWTPAQNAVLSIADGGSTVSIPVRPDQSSVVYSPQGSQVEVTLTGLRTMKASYRTLAANQRK